MSRGPVRWWDEHAVPRLADLALGNDTVRRRRAAVCEGLRGRVLELGFGSGHNVGLYPAEVEEVAAVEPSDVGWRLAERRVQGSTTPVRRTGLDGQRLAEPDASYDCVLTTFTLCTIPDHRTALDEARRVLRPGGRLHFLEHGLSPDRRVASWQRRLEPLQRRLAGGCHLTRDHAADLEASGFVLEDLSQGYLPGPLASRPMGYLYAGTARAS